MPSAVGERLPLTLPPPAGPLSASVPQGSPRGQVGLSSPPHPSAQAASRVAPRPCVPCLTHTSQAVRAPVLSVPPGGHLPASRTVCCPYCGSQSPSGDGNTAVRGPSARPAVFLTVCPGLSTVPGLQWPLSNCLLPTLVSNPHECDLFTVKGTVAVTLGCEVRDG